MTDLFCGKRYRYFNYEDDGMPFVVEENIENFIPSLASNALFDWFKNNRLKSNADRCHALVSRNKLVDIKIGDYTIDNSECNKLLVIRIDVNLSFNNHLSDFYEKASRKISALARVTPFLRLGKRKLPMNAVFTSQFS